MTSTARRPPDTEVQAAASSSSSSSAATLPPSHSISQRIRSILIQPSHDELATKRALDTVAAIYSNQRPVATSAPRDSIARLPAVPIDTERARKNLERDSRKRLHKATNDFISVLQTVDDALQKLKLDVQSMQSSCDQVQQKLDEADSSTQYLVEHAQGLQKQRNAAALQRQLSSLFLQRFTLSEEERQAIYSRELRVDDRLFAAMDRLEQIRADCRLLLEGSDVDGVGGGTRAGMDIMSSTAEDLEQSYQKIYKWCSFEFRQPVKEGLEVSFQLCEAVRRLMRARQDLLRSALSTLVMTRSSILMNSFVNALTVGGPAPTFLPRPIELHAHDPLRYIGDMLAWIHQTLASEREFLTPLFGEKEGEGGRRIGQRRRGLEGSVDLTSGELEAVRLGPGEALVREVLNKNLEGCCRPLKIRVQQTVRSQEGSVTTYRLAHLVQFYRSTMEKTIGTKATLSQTLGEIASMSLDAFFVTLDRLAAGLSRFEDVPESDLGPPSPLVGATGTLKELLAEYQRSLSDEAELQAAPAQAPARQAGGQRSLDDFDLVLERTVDPMRELCRRMAELAVTRRARTKTEDAAKWDAAVFLCNCYGYLVNVLQPYEFTRAKAEQVKTDMQAAADELTERHYEQLLEESGLSPVVSALTTKSAETPLSHHPDAEPGKLSTQLARFSDLLSSAEVVTSARLARVQSPALRSEMHTRALRRLMDAYGSVVDAVRHPANRYEWRETLIRRSRDEVELLLGLNGERG